MTKTSILFVCMGNVCRSPTAEGVLRARAAKAGLGDRLHIDSAGTHPHEVGRRPDPRSTQYAARRGYDLSTQRARQVAASDFETFDHIYAMDGDNLAYLVADCPPQHRHKLGLFMQFAGNSKSEVVPDPYHGDGKGFDKVLDYIEDASDGLLAVLQGRHEELTIEVDKDVIRALGRPIDSGDDLMQLLETRKVRKISLQTDPDASYEQVGKVIYIATRLGVEVSVNGAAPGGQAK